MMSTLSTRSLAFRPTSLRPTSLRLFSSSSTSFIDGYSTPPPPLSNSPPPPSSKSIHVAESASELKQLLLTYPPNETLKALGLTKFSPSSLIPIDSTTSIFCAPPLSPPLPHHKTSSFSSLHSKLAPDASPSFSLATASPLDALAYTLGAYKYTRYKTSSPPTPSHPLLSLPALSDADLSFVSDCTNAVYVTRNLIKTPAEDLSPATLEAALKSLHTATPSATFTSYVGSDLLTPNAVFSEVRPGGTCNLIHAVGRAGLKPDRQPRLLDFNHVLDPSFPSITLVGKGVTFDTGGLSMKSPGGMLNMKKDMGGAAHVIGLAKLLLDQQVPVNLRVLIPAVENNVDADSIRPLDIVSSLSGLTTEIGNTDAEGRLILADALSLASARNPDLIVDFATLTGAARVALGLQVGAYFTNDDEVAAAIDKASTETQDPLWRLPLFSGYSKRMKSTTADLRNVPADTGQGGAITAALYLQNFVGRSKRRVDETLLDDALLASSFTADELTNLGRRRDDKCPELFSAVTSSDAKLLKELALRAPRCDCKTQKWVHLDIDSMPFGSPEAQGMRAMFSVIKDLAAGI